MAFTLEAWKKYNLPDNGLYGPKGSKPKFYPENNTPLSSNFATGYIRHDCHNPDDKVNRKRILMTEIKIANEKRIQHKAEQ